MPLPKNNSQTQRGFTHIAVLFVLVLAAFAVAGFLYHKANNQSVVVRTPENDLTQDSQKRDKANKVYEYEKVTLYDGEEKVTVIQDSYGYTNVARADNWLIYLSENYSDYSVYAKNLDTGETITVLDNEKLRRIVFDHLSASENNRRYVPEDFDSFTLEYEKSLTNLRDDVIYSLHAYIAIGFLFKIDPDNLEGDEIIYYASESHSTPGILDVGDKTLFSLSFGDGCASSLTTRLFDYEAFEPYGEELNFGTFETMPIGYYAEDETYLFSEYEVDRSVPSYGCGKNLYKNIKGASFAESSTEYLTPEKMPADVESFMLDNTSNRVYLLTNTQLYYLDLLSKELVFVGNHNLTNDGFYRFWISKIPEDGGLCVSSTLIDHTTGKTIEEESEKCISEYERTAQEIFEDLDLPSNYHIETTLERY